MDMLVIKANLISITRLNSEKNRKNYESYCNLNFKNIINNHGRSFSKFTYFYFVTIMLCFNFFITLLLGFEKRSIRILSFPELISSLNSSFSSTKLSAFFKPHVPVYSYYPIIQFCLR